MTIAAAGLAGSVLAARADWQLRAVHGAGATRDTREAFVTSQTGSGTLRYGCVNGAPLLWVDVDQDLARGMVESVITFDERRPQPLLLQVFSNPRNVPLFDIALADVARAKRLRLELRPIEAPLATFDFDTRGGKKAMAVVVCGAKKPSFFRRLTRSRNQ